MSKRILNCIVNIPPYAKNNFVCTDHLEYGKCNADELYKIIESIKPDVIFEELYPKLFKIIYNYGQRPDELLEIKTIKRYLLNHNIQHIPVDIDLSDKFELEFDNMFDTIEECEAYKELQEERYLMTFRKGLSFLNSKACVKLHEKTKLTERTLIDQLINKDHLLHIRSTYYQIMEIRETEMIKNIYNFSRHTNYKQGLFFIGAGHRKSIIEIIKGFNNKETFKLNWRFYE